MTFRFDGCQKPFSACVRQDGERWLFFSSYDEFPWAQEPVRGSSDDITAAKAAALAAAEAISQTVRTLTLVISEAESRVTVQDKGASYTNGTRWAVLVDGQPASPVDAARWRNTALAARRQYIKVLAIESLGLTMDEVLKVGRNYGRRPKLDGFFLYCVNEALKAKGVHNRAKEASIK